MNLANCSSVFGAVVFVERKALNCMSASYADCRSCKRSSSLQLQVPPSLLPQLKSLVRATTRCRKASRRSTILIIRGQNWRVSVLPCRGTPVYGLLTNALTSGPQARSQRKRDAEQPLRTLYRCDSYPLTPQKRSNVLGNAAVGPKILQDLQFVKARLAPPLPRSAASSWPAMLAANRLVAPFR